MKRMTLSNPTQAQLLQAIMEAYGLPETLDPGLYRIIMENAEAYTVQDDDELSSSVVLLRQVAVVRLVC